MNAQQTWERLQAQYRDNDVKLSTLEITMHVRYGSNYAIFQHKETRELEKLRTKERTIALRIMNWLDAHSPRNWHSGVPAYWIYTELTFADATTDGPLSVTPPLGYGCSRFNPEWLTNGAKAHWAAY